MLVKLLVLFGCAYALASSEIKKKTFELRKPFGQFSTPDYPKPYPSHLMYRWNITVAKGYQILLNFTTFELEWTPHCRYDFIKVINAQGTIGKYCGSRTEEPKVNVTLPPPTPIRSHDNTLEVLLFTDFSNPKPLHGFQAHYVTIDVNECLDNNGGCSHFCHNYIGGRYCSCKRGYTLHEDLQNCRFECLEVYQLKDEPEKNQGVIQSPEYPNHYPPFARCEYHLTAEKGYYINLLFIDFQIEHHEITRCPYDMLTIEDVKEHRGPFCGKNNPGTFRSTSNWLIVQFKSDHMSGLRGFKAQFSLEAAKCEPIFAPTNGYMTGPTNYTFKETLNFACNKGYKYDGSSTRTCQWNGTWSGNRGTCTRITCGDPNSIPDNGFIEDLRNVNKNQPYYYGTKLTVKCSPLYDIFGSKTITCVDANKWEGVGAFCVKTCGKTAMPYTSIEKCHSGHRSPTPGFSQPWLVAIKDGDKLICSGILISEQWVLTASHCGARDTPERNQKPGRLRVVLGAEDWNQETGPSVQIRKVADIVVSKKFDYGVHNDVALLKLARKVVVVNGVKEIQPICLPSEKIHRKMFREQRKVVTVGFQHEGTTRKTYRCMRLAEKRKCRPYYENAHLYIHKEFYLQEDGRQNLMAKDINCAHKFYGNSDVCSIMPGSGMVAYHEASGKWYLGGLLTWGSKKHADCAKIRKHMQEKTGSQFSLYSRVTRYVKWIKSLIGLNLRYPDTNFTYRSNSTLVEPRKSK